MAIFIVPPHQLSLESNCAVVLHTLARFRRAPLEGRLRGGEVEQCTLSRGDKQKELTTPDGGDGVCRRMLEGEAKREIGRVRAFKRRKIKRKAREGAMKMEEIGASSIYML